MNRIVVVGGGAHAKVVIEAIRAQGLFEVVGVTDLQSVGSSFFGVPVLGNDDFLPELARQGINFAVIALGDNHVRQKAGVELRRIGFNLPAIIHPAALISPSARICAGVVMMAGAVLGTDTRVDDLAIVNTGAIVDHDGVIEEAAHVAPGCALAGGVRIGRRALIGIGSSIKPGISIGADAVVGAGSAVVHDVADRCVVGGAPARPLGTKMT